MLRVVEKEERRRRGRGGESEGTVTTPPPTAARNKTEPKYMHHIWREREEIVTNKHITPGLVGVNQCVFLLMFFTTS